MVKVSRRRSCRGGRGAGRRGMVASQSVVQESQNDMYCAPIPHYGEFYPDSHYYSVPGAPPEMCPTHICTVHGDYGMNLKCFFKVLVILLNS